MRRYRTLVKRSLDMTNDLICSCKMRFFESNCNPNVGYGYVEIRW